MSGYIIKQIKDLTRKIFNNFIIKLGLDPSKYLHLYDISFELVRLNNCISRYDSKNNKILFDKNYMSCLFEKMETSSSLETRSQVLLNIIEIIVKEWICANRNLIIANDFSFVPYAKVKDNDVKSEQSDYTYDVNSLRLLLSDMLSKDYVKDFELFIPIRSIKRNNTLVNVICYNRKTKNYEVFKKVKVKDKLSEDDLLKEVGYYLNENKVKSSKIINSSIESSESFSIGNHLYGFEKIIIDTLASYIVMSRNSSVIDLQKLHDRIMIKCNDTDIIIGSKIINALGIDMVKWFLTSNQYIYYEDYFKDQFKDEYYNLILHVDNVYQCIKIQEKPKPEDIKIINDILYNYNLRKGKGKKGCLI